MTVKIDARLQEAAIVLAEELHFGRAAQRLHIAVSTLSKQIAQLEDKLGTKLFERDSKSVQLTEPGRAYVENARSALLQGERAVLLARAAKEGLDHVLVVGHSPYTDPTLISLLLSIHLPLYPKLQVQLHSDFVFNLVNSLVTTELDMALIAWPPEGQALTLVHIVTAALHVLLPEEHPAAQQDEVTLTDLKNDPWILFNKHAHPLLYDGIFQRAEALGIRPKEAHRIVTPDEAFHLVTNANLRSESPTWNRCSRRKRLRNACMSVRIGFGITPLVDDLCFPPFQSGTGHCATARARSKNLSTSENA